MGGLFLEYEMVGNDLDIFRAVENVERLDICFSKANHHP